LTVSDAIRATRLPVTVSPVIETIRTFGWPTSASPISPPAPDNTLTTPAGRMSAAILANARGAASALTAGGPPCYRSRASPSFHELCTAVVPGRKRHDADRPPMIEVPGCELLRQSSMTRQAL
jgi:hypothetical protein